CYNRCLLAYRGGSLGIRRRADVTQAEDVAEARVAKGFMLGFEPAISIAQCALANELRRMLRWNYMQQIELAFLGPALTISIDDVEAGFARRPIDGRQAIVELELCAVTFDVFHQAGHEVGNAEQHGAR